MKESTIAVLDIGKTNKKIVIYNQALQPIKTVVANFPQTTDAEGYLHDDVKSLEKWFLEQLSLLTPHYKIDVISISAHGATWTALDENGNLAFPEYCYTGEPGEEFHTEFYKTFGSPEDLQRETATPQLSNFLSIGKAIYFMKKKYPEEFKKVKHICTYNIHFGFLLTGKNGAEPTYVGCHGYLWDFEKNSWSSLVDKLEIRHALPKTIQKSWDCLGTVSPAIAKETGLPNSCIVTMGIHDSNAALLPYTITMGDDFLLNTTGTWCVIMHEEKKAQFAEDEIGKTVFFNCNAFGNPVKTTIFLGGLEYEKYSKLINDLSGVSNIFEDYNEKIINKILTEKSFFVLPTVQAGTGQFPKSTPRVIENGVTYTFEDIASGKAVPPSFKDVQMALHALIISLVIQTKICFERSGMKKGLPVFTEGGFRKNIVYNRILAAIYKDSSFYLTGIAEASAYGAAILGKAAHDKISPDKLKNRITIEKQLVEPANISGFEEYMNDWLEKMNG